MTPLLQSSLDEAREEGMKKGRLAGKKEGRQEGRQEGLSAGMEKGRQELILNMLKKSADLRFISEVTGLSVKTLKKLKNGNSE